jgi:hypothetical protein
MSVIRRTSAVALLCGSALALSPPVARAQFLTPQEAGAILQSTISDTEFTLLELFVGFTGQSLFYSGLSTATAWSGLLTGTYAGSSVSATYLGDVSAFPGGAITWTTSGTYGASPWTGSGNALITGGQGAYQILFQHTFAVAGHTGSANWLIDLAVTSTGAEFVGASGPLLADAADEEGVPSYLQVGRKFVSDVTFPDSKPHKKTKTVNRGTKENTTGGGLQVTATISAVPEPSSAILLGSALLVGAAAARGHRRREARGR